MRIMAIRKNSKVIILITIKGIWRKMCLIVVKIMSKCKKKKSFFLRF